MIRIFKNDQLLRLKQHCNVVFIALFYNTFCSRRFCDLRILLFFRIGIILRLQSETMIIKKPVYCYRYAGLVSINYLS